MMATAKAGMARWRIHLFSFLTRNAAPATRFFHIPPDRVMEIGAQIEPAECRGVRWLLEEALGNLADNAITATPPGGSVTLRCGTSDTRPFIEVSDTGMGIPPAEREQVFERFYRASNARTTGSGLGLAIVSEVARMHGASVEIMQRADDPGTVVRMAFTPVFRAIPPAHRY